MPDDEKDKPAPVPKHPLNASRGRSPMTRLLLLIVPAVVLVAAVVLLVVFTFNALPQNNAQVAAWSTPETGRENAPEPPGWENVRDDTYDLAKPYFTLLEKARNETLEDLRKNALVNFSYADVARKPWEFREKLLRVTGQVIDVRYVSLNHHRSEADFGGAKPPEKEAFQIEIVTLRDGSVIEKYFLHTRDFPLHLSPGDKVRFSGYFYSLYKGKIIEQKEGGKNAEVVAPLLVGKQVERTEPRQYSSELVKLPQELFTDIADRTPIGAKDEETVASAIDALKSVTGTSDLTYFDLCANPELYHGCIVKITGEVSKIEKADVPEALKKYRRVVLAIGKNTPFTRYAAAYLSPDVPRVQEMQIVMLRGVFIKTAEMEGGRDKHAYLPLMASNQAESITWAAEPAMNPWVRFILVAVIIFAALLMCVAAVIFLMVRKDRLTEMKHREALKKITDSLKKD